ncbi:MAG: PLP-dependent aminotransferase family protein [Anaerolineae bacterium]|nr:PLP-dependent aminotransferase family protein [Anaerolineae bacterium]
MIDNDLLMKIDKDSEEPIYRQLIRHIKGQIESGALGPGVRLPASRDLAQLLNISRISVVNAYAELRATGYLSARAGRGTFVNGAIDSGTPLLSTNGMRHNGNGQADKLQVYAPNDRSLRELMRVACKPGVINFSQGAPPLEFFPVHHLREAINFTLDRDGSKALAYEAPEGYYPLRVAVQQYVSALGIRCSAEQVLITGGTQQALDLVMQTVLSEGDILVTESPTYLGVIDLARTRRQQILSVPIDEDGIRLDILENYLLDHPIRMIYVMPNFQNPTGTITPLHRRRQLLALAHHYSVPVLEDGVYQELRFEGEALPPLKALDEYGIVLHASGFTKNLMPGMRIGYVIANNAYYERLVRVKAIADISSPGLNQRAIHLLLERGVLARQLERNNRELRRRRDVALVAAKRHLPKGTTWNIPSGGLYLWIKLPEDGPSAAELYISAVEAGVAYAIGSVFYPDGEGNYHLRMNFGAHKPQDIEEGFRRLGNAWRDLAQDYAGMEKAHLL